MKKLRDATIVILTKKSQGKIDKLCLAMKKRGFGVGRWNGVGGKVDAEKETVTQGAVRETEEEIGVKLKNFYQVASLTFKFPDNPHWDQAVHVFFADKWTGKPKESEEMKPKWFSLSNIPFDQMWPDDIYWLPKTLKGNLLKGNFVFGNNDIILKKAIRKVKTLKFGEIA